MIASQRQLHLPLLEASPSEATSDNVPNTCVSFVDHAVTLGLAAVLLVQFGIVYMKDEIVFEGVQWNSVVVTIVWFAMTSALYQRTAIEAQVRSVAVILLPEIVVVTIVALISFHHAILAYCILINGVLVMAVAVLLYSLSELLYGVDAVDEQPLEPSDNQYAAIAV
jgi:hypothetical protein